MPAPQPPLLDEKVILLFYRNEFKLDVAPVFKNIDTARQSAEIPWLTFMMYKCLCQSVFQLNENFFVTNDMEEITANAVPMLRMANVINRLLADLQGESNVDFSVTDIIMPVPKKTKIVLSWLIPYYEVVCQRKEYVDDVFNEIEQRRMDMEKDRFDVIVMEKNVEQKRRLIEEMRRRKNELFEEYSRLEEELRRKKSQINELKSKHAKQDEQMRGLVEQLKQEKATLKVEEDENKNLEQNIVQSPERLLSEIENLKTSIEEISSKLSDTEKSLREMQRRKADLARVMESCTQLLDELAKKVDAKWEEYRQELCRFDSDLGPFEDVKRKEEDARRQVEQARRQQCEEIQKLDQQRQQLAQKLKDQQEQKGLIVKDIRLEHEREKTLKSEIKDLKVQAQDQQVAYDETDVKFHESVTKYMGMYKEIKQKVDAEEEMLNTIATKMQQAAQLMENQKIAELMRVGNIKDLGKGYATNKENKRKP